MALMVPPLSVSLFAAIATPPAASSPTDHRRSCTPSWSCSWRWCRLPFSRVPAKSSSSCGVPVMSTAALKVTVASMTVSMPLMASMETEVISTSVTVGDALVVIALMVPFTRIRFDPVNAVRFPVRVRFRKWPESLMLQPAAALASSASALVTLNVKSFAELPLVGHYEVLRGRLKAGAARRIRMFEPLFRQSRLCLDRSGRRQGHRYSDRFFAQRLRQWSH